MAKIYTQPAQSQEHKRPTARVWLGGWRRQSKLPNGASLLQACLVFMLRSAQRGWGVIVARALVTVPPCLTDCSHSIFPTHVVLSVISATRLELSAIWELTTRACHAVAHRQSGTWLQHGIRRALTTQQPTSVRKRRKSLHKPIRHYAPLHMSQTQQPLITTLFRRVIPSVLQPLHLSQKQASQLAGRSAASHTHNCARLNAVPLVCWQGLSELRGEGRNVHVQTDNKHKTDSPLRNCNQLPGACIQTSQLDC
jgi:hypothetical protein